MERIAWSTNDPVCRVVRNAWSGEIEGVAVWDPQTWTWDVVRPTGKFAVEVRTTFANVIGEEIVNAIWPGAGMRPPASREELLNMVEALLDPQFLILKLVQATAQVAALHAGFPLPIARLIGNLAQEICKGFLGQDPQAHRVQMAQWVDFAFSAEDGSWIGSSEPREIATDRITELLGPDGPSHPELPQPAPAGQPRVLHPAAPADLSQDQELAAPAGVRQVLHPAAPAPADLSHRVRQVLHPAAPAPADLSQDQEPAEATVEKVQPDDPDHLGPGSPFGISV